MSKAFVDTTILTNILLKSGEIKELSLKALARYNETLLPVYAIKEFKAGPLKNHVWLHNKFAVLQSFSKTINSIQRMSLTPKRYTTSTALEALHVATEHFEKITSSNQIILYGDTPNLDKFLCDSTRLAIKVSIFKAWRQRRSVTTKVICPLPCYKEVAPVENGILIDIKPVQCSNNLECSLEPLLKSREEDLRKLQSAINPDSPKIEDRRRLKILKELCRKPKTKLFDNECRSLGDAIFAFLAPNDSVILTTNIRDHEPLANSLGKRVEAP